MPYARNGDLPAAVRDALPRAAQTVFRNVVNSTLDRGSSESSAFRQGWAALRHAGWRRGDRGTWVKKMSETEFRARFRVAKVNEEQGLVFGWASVAEQDGRLVVDHEGDVIEPAELEKGAYRFVKDARIASDRHDPATLGVGVLVESMIFTKEKQEILGIDVPVGWWVGFQVDDPELRRSIRESEGHEAFSIGGFGAAEEL